LSGGEFSLHRRDEPVGVGYGRINGSQLLPNLNHLRPPSGLVQPLSLSLQGGTLVLSVADYPSRLRSRHCQANRSTRSWGRCASSSRPSFGVMRRLGQALERCGVKVEPTSVGLPPLPVTT